MPTLQTDLTHAETVRAHKNSDLKPAAYDPTLEEVKTECWLISFSQVQVAVFKISSKVGHGCTHFYSQHYGERDTRISAGKTLIHIK